MMTSIDMVVSEAKHLYGLERSQIFFDLLAAELCQFGSAGAISEFVPNMAESIVRQNVISFFEHACDMMTMLMTLLLRCPDGKRLQQMPLQTFISLMKFVITSSLKTKTKGRRKLSFKRYIKVDLKEIKRALGDKIPENVLNRLRGGDEMVVHRFVDTRLERHQPSDRRENMTNHSIYFPSDCRLFIYIPTENGSYWHQSDMRRRADGINQHGSMVNENGSKEQAKQIPSSEANTDASSDASFSKDVSARIRLYTDVIRNETSRMMSSIDMVVSEAKHLFGLERSRIFFDLLSDECHFESAGAISEFVPNVAELAIRQKVISFFEHASDIINRLISLLLRSIKICATKRPSDSTRTKLDKKFVSDENLIFPSSEGVKIVSWEKVSYSKIVPATDVSSHLSSPNQINVLPEEVRMNFINRLKSIHSEDSLAHFKLPVDIITMSEKTGEKPVEDSLADFKLLVDITTTSEKTVEKLVEVLMWNMLYQNALKTAVADKRSKDVSTGSNAYPNVIRDETYIMMSSIDMVMSEAEHLFGLERSRIFFDLLAAEFCNFGSSGTISEFVPNMAESTVRQNVISFFENACGTMNRLMTLLLRCPDSKILQQMPVQNLIFLMKSVITS